MFDCSTTHDIVTRHLDLLHETFMGYFPNEAKHTARVRNPFKVDCSKLSLSSEDESTLIELLFDRSLIKIRV